MYNYNQVTPYPPKAFAGVSSLVAASSLSLLSATGTLLAIFLNSTRHTSSSQINSSTSTASSSFAHSPLGAYIISLLVAELIQSAASLFSIRWLIHRGVFPSALCSLQGALKNAGNTSTAIWSLVIAFHTFSLIFLKLRIANWVFLATILGGWALVGFIVLLGPTTIETAARGPFWGVSGYWCWIAPEYTTEQFAMEYLFMLVTAVTSLVLYTLIFLHLRGNITYSSEYWFYLSFHRTNSPWSRNTSLGDPQIEKVGKSMLLYPLCYVALVLPIAICRWSESFGAQVPFELTMAADFIFLSSGVVNALLYCLTRRVPISVPGFLSPLNFSRKGRNSNGGEDGVNGDESFQIGRATAIRTAHTDTTLIEGHNLVMHKVPGTYDYKYSSGDRDSEKFSIDSSAIDVEVDSEMQRRMCSNLDGSLAISEPLTIPPSSYAPPNVLPRTLANAVPAPVASATAMKARIINPEINLISSRVPISLDDADEAVINWGTVKNTYEDHGKEPSSGAFGLRKKRGISRSRSPTYSQGYTFSPSILETDPVSPGSESTHFTDDSRSQMRHSRSSSMRSTSYVSITSSRTLNNSKPPPRHVDVPKPRPFSYIGVGSTELMVDGEGKLVELRDGDNNRWDDTEGS